MRTRLGLRLVVVADRAGMTTGELAEAEAGRSKFDLDKIERLAAALGMSVWELFRFWELESERHAE